MDAAGKRHRFPAGFDPKRAAGIVKTQTLHDANQHAADNPPEVPSALSRFGSELGNRLNPMNAVRAVQGAVADPAGAARAYAMRQGGLNPDGSEVPIAEHLIRTAGRAGAVLPGTDATNAGIRIGSGDVAGGLAEATSQGIATALPLVPRGARALVPGARAGGVLQTMGKMAPEVKPFGIEVPVGPALEKMGKALSTPERNIPGFVSGADMYRPNTNYVQGTGNRGGRLLTQQPAAIPEAMAVPAVEAPALTAAPKPKLSAPEVAAWLRQQHGSERASQMLYGKVQKKSGPGSVVGSAAARKDAIKRLAPGESQLPEAAKRAMDAKLAGSTSPEAAAYAGKAPNALAEGYFGDLLRQALMARMGQP